MEEQAGIADGCEIGDKLFYGRGGEDVFVGGVGGDEELREGRTAD